MKGGEALMRRASFVLLELPFMGQYNEAAPRYFPLPGTRSLGTFPPAAGAED